MGALYVGQTPRWPGQPGGTTLPTRRLGKNRFAICYKIPLELGLGGGQNWRGITHAVVQVAEVEPNDKLEERSKGDQEVDEPCEDADNGGKEVDHGGRRAQWDRIEN